MLDYHGPICAPREASTFRRAFKEKLGESLGTVGGSDLVCATRGGVGVDRPTPMVPIARLAANDRDYITETPAQAKGRATKMMGLGVRDECGGFECKSEWARTNMLRALEGL